MKNILGYVKYKGKQHQAELIENKMDKVKLKVYHDDPHFPYHFVNHITTNWFEKNEFYSIKK